MLTEQGSQDVLSKLVPHTRHFPALSRSAQFTK